MAWDAIWMTSIENAERTSATPARGDATPAAEDAGEAQTFGILGPVLAGAFLLWVLIVAAVGMSV
jgi:hypothetical protein